MAFVDSPEVMNVAGYPVEEMEQERVNASSSWSELAFSPSFFLNSSYTLSLSLYVSLFNSPSSTPPYLSSQLVLFVWVGPDLVELLGISLV